MRGKDEADKRSGEYNTDRRSDRRAPDYTTYISKISGSGFLERQIVVANNPFEAIMKLADIYRGKGIEKKITNLEISVQETEVVQ